MGRFPKELFPIGDLCFHAADAIQKRGEVCNAMGFRSKLEAGIVKQSNELINAFRCVLSFFPKDCGSALIRIGDPDQFIERVGDSLKQRRILLFRLFAWPAA